MLGTNALGPRFLDDEDASEAPIAPERAQKRAQPMSLAQLLAAKRAGTTGRHEEQQQPPRLSPYEHSAPQQRYERVELVASVPRFMSRTVDYSAIQRRLAEQRERLRNESAAVIQRCFRRYQHHCYVLQCRAMLAAEEEDQRYEAEFLMEQSEQELRCESVLIPWLDATAFDVETSLTETISPPSPPIRHAMTPVSHSPEHDKASLRMPPPSPLPLTMGERLPEFVVDVQLVSARGLLSDIAIAAGGAIDLELSLCSSDGTTVVKRTASQDLPPQLANSSALVETAMEADTSLRFTGDGVVDPQAIVDEWSVCVAARVRSARGREVQGNLSVPLVLLETGLASEYALCRWFPLEKANPGDLTRGELRLSIRVLARATDTTGCELMTPYAPPKRAEVTPSRKETVSRAKSGRKPLPSRRGRRPQPTSTARKTESSTDLDRSCTTRAVTPPSPVRERIPRAEAISPPSSPASTSSSDMVSSPVPEHQQRKPTPRSSLSQHQPPPSRGSKTPERRVSLVDRVSRLNSAMNRSTSPTRGASPGRSDDDSDDDSKPKQPFLKRKPYKVVFQRLDWSTVPSKTDSRLATSNGKPVSVPRQYQSQFKSQPKPQSKTGGPPPPVGESRVRNGEASDACIDSMTRQRLEQLELAMHECCGVSERSAALVHLKYETERKMFAIAQAKRLQEAQMATGAESISSVEELWERLAADPTGEFYASQLEGFSNWAEEAQI
jgi:hypothetical protein